MAKWFRSNDTWRHEGYTGRTISHVKVGDVIECYRNVQAEFSVGKRRNYYKSKYYSDGNNSKMVESRKRLKCRLRVVKVYPFFIQVEDMDKQWHDTLDFGDLVFLGIEPGFEGYSDKEHRLKEPLPWQLHSKGGLMF